MVGIDPCGYIYGSCSMSVCILLLSDASRKRHVGVLTCNEAPYFGEWDCLSISIVTVYVYLRIRIGFDHSTLIGGSRPASPMLFDILHSPFSWSCPMEAGCLTYRSFGRYLSITSCNENIAQARPSPPKSGSLLLFRHFYFYCLTSAFLFLEVRSYAVQTA